MGELTLVWFGVLAMVGLVLITIGAVRRHRSITLLGVALLAALAGLWIVGPLGLCLGGAVLVFLWIGRGKSEGRAGE